MVGRDVMARQRAGTTPDLIDRRASPDPADGLSHTALLYRDTAEYVRELVRFSQRAATAQAPLYLALPRSRLKLARKALPVLPPRSRIADISDLGRNPARLIPAVQAFADEHPGEQVYCAWEPTWPGRSPGELTEVGRHEALCNLAFDHQPMTMLCLYSERGLSQNLLSDIERTHPAVAGPGVGYDDGNPAGYLGAGVVPPRCDRSLPPPAPDAASITFTDHLAAAREFTARHARAAGLSAARTGDLTLAVNEIAANSLAYAGGGVLRIWCTGSEIICQLEDSGQIGDPLAGLLRRPPDAAGGHGLRLVNLVCDLVERRTGPAGTVTRLHLRRRGG
jgi:anti-sigma regulatory factor (Ser/Thr protein kinase)